MDVSGLILIPLAAIITACWMIGAAILSKSGPSFQAPFLLSYGLGIILMGPWEISAWQELGMFAIMLVMLSLWIALGCIIGGVPAALAISAGAKLRQRFRGRSRLL